MNTDGDSGGDGECETVKLRIGVIVHQVRHGLVAGTVTVM